MKFATAALLTRIDELEVDREDKARTMHEARVAAWQDALDRYTKVDQPKLLEELRKLVDRCRKGRVISVHEISVALSTGNSDNGHYFKPPRDPRPKDRGYYDTLDQLPEWDYQPDPKLAALRALLVQVHDETITTRDLKELGFDPAAFVSAAV